MVQVASLALLLSATVHAQDFLSGELSSERNIALIEREDSDSKESVSDNQSQTPEHQNWLFHVQGTEIAQGQPGFHSPYAGTNSLRSNDNFRQASSIDIYLGAHIWPGGEIYFNPEYYQGFGLGDTHGIAAFPNAATSKVGQKIGDIATAHLFLRQTFGLGGEQEELAGDQLQLAERVDISRLTFTIGRLTTGDQFDVNAYAHSANTQFLNWVLVNNGAYDYAGDSLGFIDGGTVELNQKTWALRY
jgi:high affinity Mn2+ porin